MAQQNVAKTKISKTIRNHFLRKFGGLKLATRTLGLPSYDALRQDLTKNKYFEEDLLLICREIGLPGSIAQLAEKFEFQLKRGRSSSTRSLLSEAKDSTVSATFSMVDARMDRVAQFAAASKDVVPRIFAALSEKDFVAAFISDEFPAHWQGPDTMGMASAICEALQRQAMIAYFYPSAELVSYFQEAGCSAQMFTKASLEPAFKNFVDRMAQMGARDHVKNLQLIACSNPVAFAPQHRYGLYFHKNESGLMVRATQAIPVRHGNTADEVSSQFWVFTCGYKFTAFLQQACESTLISELKSSAELPERCAILRTMLDRCYFQRSSQEGF